MDQNPSSSDQQPLMKGEANNADVSQGYPMVDQNMQQQPMMNPNMQQQPMMQQ